MKRLLLLFLCFIILLTIHGQNGSFTITSSLGSLCLLNMDAEFTAQGTVNGKNRYVSNSGVNEIVWTGSRWEIRTTSSVVYYTSSVDAGVKVPDIPDGNWQNGPNSCGGVAAFQPCSEDCTSLLLASLHKNIAANLLGKNLLIFVA